MRWLSAAETLQPLQTECRNRVTRWAISWFQMSRLQFCRAARISNDVNLRHRGREFEESSAPLVRAQHLPMGWLYGLFLEPKERWVVIQGRMATGGVERTVELIVPGDEEAVQEYLAELPSTAIQCFINGAGAVHLYGMLAGRRAQYVWEDGTVKGTAREGQWIRDIHLGEFEDVRFSECSPPETVSRGSSGGSLTRDSSDSRAIFLSNEPRSSSPGDDQHEALPASCQLTWWQLRDRIAIYRIGNHTAALVESDDEGYTLPDEIDEYLAEHGL